MILHFNHIFLFKCGHFVCQGTVVVLYWQSNYRRICFCPLWGWEWGSEETKATVGPVPVGTDPPWSKGMPGAHQKHDLKAGSCSKKDSPPVLWEALDGMERLWSSQQNTLWCFSGISWNLSVLLQSLSAEQSCWVITVTKCSSLWI